MIPDDNKFKFKKCTSFTLFISFIILCISGFALYIKPEGDIANWTGWTFLGLDKEGWEGFHALFSFFFLVVAVIHLFYNWKVLIHYLKKKAAKGLTLKREFYASALIVLFFLTCTVMQVQPFWKIAQWRQALKKNKGLITIEEPEPDFQKRKISYIAEFFNMPADALIEKLNQHNIHVNNANERLIDVAKANKTSPEKICIYLEENDK